MKSLSGKDEESGAIVFFEKCAEIANKATCERSRCGSVIVKDGKIIGTGFNSPPKGLESQRRCKVDKSCYDMKVTDKTCCMHAEHRAIIDALLNNSGKVPGSTLFFIRLMEDGTPSRAGNPYCTICSKFALEAGIKDFVLWHKEGICAYGTEEYNKLSYEFTEDGLK